MAGRQASDPIVGRERELAALNAALEDALAGRGRIVMLAGEPGIGKTRLTEECTDAAIAIGASVVRGDCNEAAAAEPYWVWSQILSDVVRQGGGPLTAAAQAAVSLLPSAEPQRLSSIADIGAGSPSGTPFRLSSALLNFVLIMSSERPAVILLDDLHWADRPSLAVLEFISQSISDTRVLVLGAYRDADLSRGHPLAEVLGTLARFRHFVRIPVRGLSTQETELLVRRCTGFAPERNLLDELHGATEGNPFFIREIAREIADSTADPGDVPRSRPGTTSFRIPASVREVIGQRLHRLSAKCNRVLGIAAIVGREFTLQEIEHLARPLADRGGDDGRLSADAISEALDEAVAARLIVERRTPAPSFSFGHALIRHAMEDVFPLRTRMALHASAADMLEGMYGETAPEHAAEIAGHLAYSGAVSEPSKLSDYAFLAGKRAISADDPRSAIQWFELAEASADLDTRQRRDLAGWNDSVATTHERRVALIRAPLALARYVTASGRQDAQERWDQLAETFWELLRLGETATALKLASVRFAVARLTRILPVTTAAVSIAEPGSLERGELLCRHGVALWEENGDFAAAETAISEALAIANEQADTGLEFRASRHLCQLSLAQWEHSDAALHGARSWKIWMAPESPDRTDVGFGDRRTTHSHRGRPNLHSYLIPALIAKGRFTEARNVADDLLSVAARIGNWSHYSVATWSSVEAQYWKAVVARALGDWESLNGLFKSDIAETPASLIPTRRLIVALVEVDSVAHTDGLASQLHAMLLEALTAVRPELGDLPGFGIGISPLPTIGAAAYDLRDEALMREVKRLALDTVSWTPPLPRYVIQGRLALGFAAALEGNGAAAAEVHDRLLRWRELFDVHGGFSYARLLGLLARTTGDSAGAERHFDSAIGLCRGRGFMTEIPRIYRDYAETLAERGDRATKLEVIEAGESAASGSRMPPVLARLRLLRRRLGNVRSEPSCYPDGLSQREVEVLRLIAAGKTNQAIAELLGISRYTVIRHVTNIFGKIDASNRADAASFAHRHHLTG